MIFLATIGKLMAGENKKLYKNNNHFTRKNKYNIYVYCQDLDMKKTVETFE